jgi:hypothetical protein
MTAKMTPKMSTKLSAKMTAKMMAAANVDLRVRRQETLKVRRHPERRGATDLENAQQMQGDQRRQEDQS